MTLKTKRECWGCSEPMLELHPTYRLYPTLCPWCHGEKEIVVDVDFYDFDKEFHSVDWEKTQYNNEDLYAEIVCECGDAVRFVESGQIKACSCGRVYTLSVAVKVNEDYFGSPVELEKLYKEKI